MTKLIPMLSLYACSPPQKTSIKEESSEASQHELYETIQDTRVSLDAPQEKLEEQQVEEEQDSTSEETQNESLETVIYEIKGGRWIIDEIEGEVTPCSPEHNLIPYELEIEPNEDGFSLESWRYS